MSGHRPKVLILDINMPGGSGLAAIPTIREQCPETQIVVLTMQDETAFAREALQAGVLGYILKEAASEELVKAVRMAAEGRTYLQPELGARLAAEPDATTPDDLSERELEVLQADRPRPHQQRDRRAPLPERAGPSSHTARTSSRNWR